MNIFLYIMEQWQVTYFHVDDDLEWFDDKGTKKITRAERKYYK